LELLPFFHKILILFVFFSKTIRKFIKLQKCSACQDLQKISYSWKCASSVWRIIPLEMHFLVDSLLLVTQIIKGKQIYYKMWSSKSYILRIIDIYVFFTAILITYIKFFWRRGLQWRGLHLLFFYRSYQVLLTDVVFIPRWAMQAPVSL
jgi:hypothetical protein